MIDLIRQSSVEDWMAETRPETVVMGAHTNEVERFLSLDSPCTYGRQATQSMAEKSRSRPACAYQKTVRCCQNSAGLSQQYCRNWVSAMSTNLYGPSDNYDLNTCTVLPTLLHKFHGPKRAGTSSITFWGTGL